jgi:hypothetical protein
VLSAKYEFSQALLLSLNAGLRAICPNVASRQLDRLTKSRNNKSALPVTFLVLYGRTQDESETRSSGHSVLRHRGRDGRAHTEYLAKRARQRIALRANLVRGRLAK